METTPERTGEMTDLDRESAGPDLKRSEVVVAWVLLASAFLLRFLYAFRYTVDSDEPQHLHVIWAWTRGLVQYRDIFDNHTPLFHMLYAPLAAVLGERADLLVFMRLTMPLLCALGFLGLYFIGASLFSRRVGLWTAVLISVTPPVFVRTVEFRADVLWMTCWLLTIAVLVRPPLRRGRSFLTGLLLGVTVAVSLKTVFLMAALLAAALVSVLVRTGVYPWRRLLRRVLSVMPALLLGFLLVPLALVVFFSAMGALGPLYHGTIGHNLPWGLYHMRWLRPPLACIIVGVGLLCARLVKTSPSSGGLALRRTFVLLLGGMLLLAITFWTVAAKQSYIPIYPFLVLLTVVCVDGVLHRLAGRVGLAPRRSLLYPVAALAAAVMLAGLVVDFPRRNEAAEDVQRWQQVLRLTDSDQTVMDLKGELIFRRRACRHVFELLTRTRFRMGQLPDDVAEHLIATRTCVASPNLGGLPPAAVRFVNENYVPAGLLLVAGKMLRRPNDGTPVVKFDVQIPAEYAIITPTGPAGGGLDGRPCRGGRFLASGPHEYRPAAGETKLALFWTQALKRGFSPFQPSPAESQP